MLITVLGRSDWKDVDALADEVSVAKEASYKELTKGGIQAFPGVVDLIIDLKSAGIPIAVGSSGSPEKIQHNLTSAGLQSYFSSDKIVSAKMVCTERPHAQTCLPIWS